MITVRSHSPTHSEYVAVGPRWIVGPYDIKTHLKIDLRGSANPRSSAEKMRPEGPINLTAAPSYSGAAISGTCHKPENMSSRKGNLVARLFV